MVGKATEQAVLIIKGKEYRDWETIMVRQAIREVPPYRFRFTCSEAMPIANNFGVLQIKPGDDCQVYLAGHKAIDGKVSTRQVYYDKRRHYIEIQGATKSLDLSGASPITKTMEYKNVDIEQLSRSLIKPFNIPVLTEGEINKMKFPRVSLMHGLSVFDHLDMYARHVKVSFTSDENGGFVLLGDKQQSGSDTLIEGKNILIGREIVYNSAMETTMPSISQGPGGDKKSMAQVSHVPYVNEQMQSPFGKGIMPFVIPSELASSDNQQLKGRAATEKSWLKEDQVTVFITVYGWLKPSGGLWKRDEMIHIDSPMLIMNEKLRTKSVTFTQDSGEGTRTTLELCNPLALSGVPEGSQLR